MANAPRSGRVYLVGAGPGDPGLLTLRAVECLQEADFVIYDYLTSPRTLEFARPRAERFRVTQLPGTHAERWEHILAKIIAEVRLGKVVVHLKGGDPLMFGRGAEEAEVLRAAGVAYEIVPGVTAALAAAACAEIPLTHRACSSAVAFVTGHEDPSKAITHLDWQALARFPGTLAIYMGVTQLGHIATELLGHGMAADTPAALIHRASTGAQRSVVGKLATLEEQVLQADVGRPSLVLIGASVGLRPEHSWFEARPLHGMRVLITRPRAQALALARRLELLGAIPEILPAIALMPPEDWERVDRAIEQLASGGYDWAVFTSANAVSTFLGRLENRQKDPRAFGRCRIAAIGPATAAALAEFHLRADLVPEAGADSERLAAELAASCRGRRVLLPRAAQGRETLVELISKVATVDAVSVYRQIDTMGQADEILELLRRGEMDVVTLTSPNIARAFLAACDAAVLAVFRAGTTALLANSERIVEILRPLGLQAIVSSDPTEEALVESLHALATSRPDRH